MWHELIKLWKSSNLLQEAWDRSYEMIEICEEMFLDGIRVLRETDGGAINRELRKKDKTVNKYERKVRREILTHLAVKGTMDMPASLVLVTIVIDIERIGDYTKNIMDLVIYHPAPLHGGKFEDDLKRVEEATKSSFKRVNHCLKESDVEAALELISDHGWVNEVCDESIASLVMGEDAAMSNSDAAALTLYFRYLKRINAHFRNITTSVVNPFDRIGYKVKKA
jgi:phosphate uptake regulator